MVAVHPGRILTRELAARELSANKPSLALRVPSGRITSILNGNRAIIPKQLYVCVAILATARNFG
jgi:plasmid maintenance system antidote protein VapI